MRLLYISYWGVDDPLTKATIFPNLKILHQYFSKMYLATIERSGAVTSNLPDRTIHVPFYSYNKLPRIVGKSFDLIHFSIKLYLLAKREKVDMVICRGAMAASFGLFINRLSSLPFIVESFEPHADYMLEGNTWRKGGIEYRFQKWIESQSINRALILMPVSNNYANHLKKVGVSNEKIRVMPCCVDLEKFRLNLEARKRIRVKLNIPDQTIVGIYVGKFGDIYLREEAFTIFRKAQEYFKNNFFLIILSPISKIEIESLLHSAKLNCEKVHVDCVAYSMVPDYLSAADLAFSLIRPSASRKYCSPIKNGEYWANGLPILLTRGVGDDDAIISNSKNGAIVDLNYEIEPKLEVMKKLVEQGREVVANRVTPLAFNYRNFEIIAKGYAQVFGKGYKSNETPIY